MKKIEVFRITIADSSMDIYEPHRGTSDIVTVRNWTNNWLESEEAKFLTEHSSTPIERVEHKNHEKFETHIIFQATLDEKIETFWRLKFK